MRGVEQELGDASLVKDVRARGIRVLEEQLVELCADHVPGGILCAESNKVGVYRSR